MNMLGFPRLFSYFQRNFGFIRCKISDNRRHSVLNSLLTSVDQNFSKSENYQFFISEHYENLYKSLKLFKGDCNIVEADDLHLQLRNSHSMLFKLFVEEKYGGIGSDYTNFAYLIERLGPKVDISYLMIVNQLLCCQAIIKYGNDEQKNKYLKKLSNGESLCSFCLHELSSGNNIYMMEGSAEYCSSTGKYIVTAKKNWICNAQFMNICIVFVKMKNKEGFDCISAFIKESPLQSEGVTISKCDNILNISNVWDVTLNNVSFSEEDILGSIGEGFKIAVELQNSARFAIAASLLGITKKSVQQILNLNKLSSDVNAKILKWTANIFAVESALYFTTNITDDYPTSTFDVEFAALKIKASKTAFEVINDCIDIARSNGEEELYYLNLLDIARGLELFLGSSDVLTYFIGGQSIQYILPELKNDILNFRKSHESIWCKIKFFNINETPSFYKDCSIDKNIAAVKDCLSYLRKEIILSVSQHAFDTPNQDFLQARLGKCLVTIYHLLTVIGHHKLLSERKVSHEMEVLIKRSMDNLRLELIDTIGEGYDRISFNVVNTKYRAISKIVTKSEVHGIESAIARNW